MPVAELLIAGGAPAHSRHNGSVTTAAQIDGVMFEEQLWV